jgi:hypothetical protein
MGSSIERFLHEHTGLVRVETGLSDDLEQRIVAATGAAMVGRQCRTEGQLRSSEP